MTRLHFEYHNDTPGPVSAYHTYQTDTKALGKGSAKVGVTEISVPYSCIPLTSPNYDWNKLFVSVAAFGVHSDFVGSGTLPDRDHGVAIENEAQLREYTNIQILRAIKNWCTAQNHFGTFQLTTNYKISVPVDGASGTTAAFTDATKGYTSPLNLAPADAFFATVTVTNGTNEGPCTLRLYALTDDGFGKISKDSTNAYSVFEYNLGHLYQNETVVFDPSVYKTYTEGGVQYTAPRDTLTALPNSIFMAEVRGPNTGNNCYVNLYLTPQCNPIVAGHIMPDRKTSIGLAPVVNRVVHEDQAYYQLTNAHGFFGVMELDFSADLARRLGVSRLGFADETAATSVDCVHPDSMVAGARSSGAVAMNNSGATPTDSTTSDGERDVEYQTTLFENHTPALYDVARINIVSNDLACEPDYYSSNDQFKLIAHSNVLYTFSPGLNNNATLIGAKTLIHRNEFLNPVVNPSHAADIMAWHIAIHIVYHDGSSPAMVLQPGDHYNVTVSSKDYGTTER